MELRYFKCAKCDNMYQMADRMIKENMVCGVLVGFIIRDGNEVPYGCGGGLVEITEKEAMDLAYEKRLT